MATVMSAVGVLRPVKVAVSLWTPNQPHTLLPNQIQSYQHIGIQIKMKNKSKSGSEPVPASQSMLA